MDTLTASTGGSGRRMWCVALGLAIVSVLGALWATRTRHPELLIDVYTPGSRIVPDTTKGHALHADPIGFGLRPESSEPVIDALRVVRSCLSNYPEGFLARYARRVCIVSNLSVDGVAVGGGWIDGTAFVSFEPGRMWSADERLWCQFALNHELAHAIFDGARGRFDIATWMRANVDGFRYGKGGFEYLKKPPKFREFPDVLLDGGFVSDYARSAIEEDFAETMAWMFSGDAEAWNTLKSKPRVRAKMMAAADFLGQLDRRISWEFFEALPRSSAPKR